MEPRQARDIGCAAGTERAPEAFAADPRPLWGLGLTPMPKASQEMRGKG